MARGKIPILSVVGKSDSGKTTLLEGLIRELKQRGYRVGTIKHDAHSFEIDVPGKDSWRHAQAGSDHVVISSPLRVASIRRVEREPQLEELAAGMTDVDIILTEGYKRGNAPKIEVSRRARSSTLICRPTNSWLWPPIILSTWTCRSTIWMTPGAWST